MTSPQLIQEHINRLVSVSERTSKDSDTKLTFDVSVLRAALDAHVSAGQPVSHKVYLSLYKAGQVPYSPATISRRGWNAVMADAGRPVIEGKGSYRSSAETDCEAFAVWYAQQCAEGADPGNMRAAYAAWQQTRPRPASVSYSTARRHDLLGRCIRALGDLL